MDDLEKHFAAVVKRRRQRLNLSQEAFADKAGIHRTYASAIERGRVQVSIVIASRIADALEMPLSRLFREVEKLATAQDDSDGA
jgi:transcriptional regulator with XRE-family HTH domain